MGFAGIMLASLLKLPAAQALGQETEQASGGSTPGAAESGAVQQQVRLHAWSMAAAGCRLHRGMVPGFLLCCCLCEGQGLASYPREAFGFLSDSHHSWLGGQSYATATTMQVQDPSCTL